MEKNSLDILPNTSFFFFFNKMRLFVVDSGH